MRRAERKASRIRRGNENDHYPTRKNFFLRGVMCVKYGVRVLVEAKVRPVFCEGCQGELWD